jgi:hypothetical protein
MEAGAGQARLMRGVCFRRAYRGALTDGVTHVRGDDTTDRSGLPIRLAGRLAVPCDRSGYGRPASKRMP